MVVVERIYVWHGFFYCTAFLGINFEKFYIKPIFPMNVYNFNAKPVRGL